MRLILWFVVGLVLGAVSLASWAATTAQTQETWYRVATYGTPNAAGCSNCSTQPSVAAGYYCTPAPWTVQSADASSYTCLNTTTSATMSGTMYSAVFSTCPSGFVYRSDIGLCSNVNTVAGGAAPSGAGDCGAGKDQQMVLSPTSTGMAPLTADYGGCNFSLSFARSCTIDGVDKICGTYTSTGTIAAGGSTVVGSSSTPLPGTCPNGKITNVLSGVVTCLDGSETKPAIVSTGGTDASGNVVQVTTKCIGDQCTQIIATTSGGNTTTAQGPVPAGGTSPSSDRIACGVPGYPNCKMDETGTSDSSGAGAAGSALKGSYDTLKGQADSSASSHDMSGFGVPVFTAPSDSAGAVSNPFSGTHTCVNPSITMLTRSVTLDVCAITAPLKTILYWAINVLVAMYAWSAFARRRGEVA